MVDNAIDIWKNATAIIESELLEEEKSRGGKSWTNNWLGSRRLNTLMENGMKLMQNE